MVKTLNKRMSKKSKSAWKKYDVKDVDEFLYEQSNLQHIGNFSDKKDEELFTIDVKEDANFLLSSKEKRKIKVLKTANFVLENKATIQHPISQRNKVKKNGRNLDEEVMNPTSQRQLQANKDRRSYDEKLQKKLLQSGTLDFKKNIWEQNNEIDLKEFTQQEWVSKNLALYHLKDTGRELVKTPGTLRVKTSVIRSIENPDPGMSYNPSFKDHQNLVEKVILKEEAIFKNELHLKRVTTDMFSKITEQQRDLEKLNVLTGEIQNRDGYLENAISDASENVNKSINSPAIKKKDKKSHRKQKHRIEIIRKQKDKKMKKEILGGINELKKIESEVLVEETKKINMKKRKQIERNKKKFKAKRLGKLKFEEPDLDFNEGSAIVGNIRNIKAESSLLVDRYKSFQKRNILPASVDVGLRKRKKIKRFTRSSHKEIQTILTKTK